MEKQKGESQFGFAILLLVLALGIYIAIDKGLITIAIGSVAGNDPQDVLDPASNEPRYWQEGKAQYQVIEENGESRTVIVESEEENGRVVPKVILVEDVYEMFSTAIEYSDLNGKVVAMAESEFESGQMTVGEWENEFGMDLSKYWGKQTLLTGVFSATATVDLLPLLDENSYKITGDIVEITLPKATVGKATLAGLRNATDLEKGVFWRWGALDEEVWIPARAVNNLIANADNDLYKVGVGGTTLAGKLARKAQEEAENFAIAIYNAKVRRDLASQLLEMYTQLGLSQEEAKEKSSQGAYSRNIVIKVFFQ